MRSARGRRSQILIALCAAGVALFNFPLLAIWDHDATLFGLPLLPVALFAIWAGLILALALISERGPRTPPPQGPDRKGPSRRAPTATGPNARGSRLSGRDAKGRKPPDAGMAGAGALNPDRHARRGLSRSGVGSGLRAQRFVRDAQGVNLRIHGPHLLGPEELGSSPRGGAIYAPKRFGIRNPVRKFVTSAAGPHRPAMRKPAARKGLW